MANILLKTLYCVEHNPQFWNPHTEHFETWETYNEMQDLSIQSFQNNLAGDWELVDIRETLRGDLQRAFQQTMRVTRELLQTGNTVLYCDPDTLCVNSWEPWGKYRQFRLFEWNVNSSKHFEIQEASDNYWNCSLRYFPDCLDALFFKRMKFYLRNWDSSRYAHEQWIYWRLMWDQLNLDRKASSANSVKYNIPPTDAWREDIPSSARVLHFGASTAPEAKLKDMREIWKQRHTFHL